MERLCLSAHAYLTLFDYIDNGESLDDFLEGFPTISRELTVQVLEQRKRLGQEPI